MSPTWHVHPGTDEDGVPSSADRKAWAKWRELDGGFHIGLIATQGRSAGWTDPELHGWLVTEEFCERLALKRRRGTDAAPTSTQRESRRADAADGGDLSPCSRPWAISDYIEKGTRLSVSHPAVRANPSYFAGIVPLPRDDGEVS